MEHNYRIELLLLDGSSRLMIVRTDKIYRKIVISVEGKPGKFKFSNLRNGHLIYREVPLDPKTGAEIRICPVCKIRPIETAQGRQCADCGRTIYKANCDAMLKKGLDRRRKKRIFGS